MPDTGLGPFVRLADVLPTLAQPERYLRRMIGNMMECKGKHGSACVRIGTTGAGVAPHYRVAPDDDYVEAVVEDKELSPYFVAYHGRSHKQLAWGSDEMRAEHWSAHPTSLEDVRKLWCVDWL